MAGLLVACSHMNEIRTVASLLPSSGSEASSAWQDLTRSLNDFLYADNSPVLAGRRSQYEIQVDENLEIIYRNGHCIGPNGKQLNDDTFCKEVTELVQRVKTTRTELMEMHSEKAHLKETDYYQGTVSATILGCIEDLEEYREWESTSDRLNQIRQCKPFLTAYLMSLSRKADEIRKHPRAFDLGLDKFDAFTFLNSSTSEHKVRVVLNMASIEKETTLIPQ